MNMNLVFIETRIFMSKIRPQDKNNDILTQKYSGTWIYKTQFLYDRRGLFKTHTRGF